MEPPGSSGRTCMRTCMRRCMGGARVRCAGRKSGEAPRKITRRRAASAAIFGALGGYRVAAGGRCTGFFASAGRLPGTATDAACVPLHPTDLPSFAEAVMGIMNRMRENTAVVLYILVFAFGGLWVLQDSGAFE